MRLYHSNADVDRFEAHCLVDAVEVLCHSVCESIAGHKNEQVHKDALANVAKMNASDAGGLPALIICLSVGKPNMTMANIDVSDRLVNENMSSLRYIERDEHDNLARLWLQFPMSR
ncbi:hypothetical protein MTO96_033017, partial [Rhipicephalus appendiculatus]